MTLLAYHAFDTVHAIGLTLVRLVVTKRRLLEWETAATDRGEGDRRSPAGGAAAIRARDDREPAGRGRSRRADRSSATRPRWPAAAPFLLLWTVAPAVAYWLSLPVGARVRPLDDADRRLLRRTARKTWRYFETFVTAADAWLPPDNYQEAGDEPRLARRTSPTNIAMSLLSTLAAHDLGYLSTAGAGRAARSDADDARRAGTA